MKGKKMKSAIFYNKSINHFGEEVCGDNYQSITTENSKIAVLSDGLGSGIKASILSILSTEIISTMLEKGISLDEVVDTITKTLPFCKTREIAYATFTIIEFFNDGRVKLVNYDNPRAIVFKGGKIFKPNYLEVVLNKKTIKQCEFQLCEGDFIFLMSDGVVHAGIGNLLDFGWGIESIEEYLLELYNKTHEVKEIVDNLMELTETYYGFKPGDDATLVGIKIIEKPRVKIFTGPPLDPRNDDNYAKEFMEFQGKKIICGGTTGNIISEFVGHEIKINMSAAKDSTLPPYGELPGVELITEGVLTLQRLNSMFSACKKDLYELSVAPFSNGNGAEKIFLTIRECEEIHILVGRKVNVFYHNPALPFEMSIRSNLIRELSSHLERLGKKIFLEYC